MGSSPPSGLSLVSTTCSNLDPLDLVEREVLAPLASVCPEIGDRSENGVRSPNMWTGRPPCADGVAMNAVFKGEFGLMLTFDREVSDPDTPGGR